MGIIQKMQGMHEMHRNDFLMKWIKFKLAENSNVDSYEEFINQFYLSKLSPPDI